MASGCGGEGDAVGEEGALAAGEGWADGFFGHGVLSEVLKSNEVSCAGDFELLLCVLLYHCVYM